MTGTRRGERQAVPSMVFGVGFGTGTASLAAALSKPDLKARHLLDYKCLLSAFDAVESGARSMVCTNMRSGIECITEEFGRIADS